MNEKQKKQSASGRRNDARNVQDPEIIIHYGCYEKGDINGYSIAANRNPSSEDPAQTSKGSNAESQGYPEGSLPESDHSHSDHIHSDNINPDHGRQGSEQILVEVLYMSGRPTGIIFNMNPNDPGPVSIHVPGDPKEPHGIMLRAIDPSAVFGDSGEVSYHEHGRNTSFSAGKVKNHKHNGQKLKLTPFQSTIISSESRRSDDGYDSGGSRDRDEN